jgi:hypothetical protein
MHHGAYRFQTRARRLAAEHTHTRTDPLPSDQGIRDAFKDGVCLSHRGGDVAGAKKCCTAKGDPHPLNTVFPLPRRPRFPLLIPLEGASGAGGFEIESRMELHHTNTSTVP